MLDFNRPTIHISNNLFLLFPLRLLVLSFLYVDAALHCEIKVCIVDMNKRVLILALHMYNEQIQKMKLRAAISSHQK